MTRTGRLRVVLVLNLLLVGAVVAVGLSAHSLGVLAEGVDYLADAAAIGVSLLAIWRSNRPRTVKHPHGYPKATLLAAAVNAGWLLVLSLLVAAGATGRLVRGAHAADAAAAAGVAVAGGIILATGGLFWIDPAVVIVIAIVVGFTPCDCSSSLRQPDAHPLRSR